jgi:hypothetical protein
MTAFILHHFKDASTIRQPDQLLNPVNPGYVDTVFIAGFGAHHDTFVMELHFTRNLDPGR